MPTPSIFRIRIVFIPGIESSTPSNSKEHTLTTVVGTRSIKIGDLEEEEVTTATVLGEEEDTTVAVAVLVEEADFGEDD
ncbi:unnamed protein product [Dovyalis caffra]|uniref:Uncharacterized protein n=1 Tax=Dovyalis caffra TaxID=77055 RepID=A0AAV1S3J5_9ROSI|nr:unnamed protein product [Dovyalis caffra]